MFVYIVRHAWAHNRDEQNWPDDSLRELTPEGAERYARVVQTLSERGFAPTLLATSPYARCRQTAEIIAANVEGQPQIVELDALEPGSDLDPVYRWTAEQGADQIGWVGHAPDVSLMAAAMIGRWSSNLHFSKGAIAAVRFTNHLAVGDGELNWLTTPKLLGI